MSEWWTYRLSDFLMFSPATYGRLLERYHGDVWPLQWVLLALGVVLMVGVATRRPRPARAVLAVLAATWLWVAWAFHWQRYAPINWAAGYLAAAFVLQAVLLAGWAMLAQPGAASPVARGGGLLLAAAGVLFYPVAEALAGRPWRQVELFGLMPEPTALATLGLLLAAGLPHRAWLAVIPVMSLAVGAATAWALRG
jgi:hypothetical protein